MQIQADPANAARMSADQASKPGRVRRILLVDDHVDTRNVMTRILRSFDCTVEAVGTVAEALEAAESQTFDLLLSDISLPDGSGADLMRQLRQRKGLRGVAITAYDKDEALRRSGDAGFELHITKPVSLETLQEVIESAAPQLAKRVARAENSLLGTSRL